MDKELLARELHEAGREAVAKNLIVRTDVPTKGFIEWDDLTEEAREGRRVQAEYLLKRFTIAPKVVGLEGLGVGRIVHYVLPDTQHRAAIVTNSPGTVCTRSIEGNKYEDSREAGVVDLTVFVARSDSSNSDSGRGNHDFLLAGVRFDPDGAVGTWHWPEKV